MLPRCLALNECCRDPEYSQSIVALKSSQNPKSPSQISQWKVMRRDKELIIQVFQCTSPNVSTDFYRLLFCISVAPRCVTVAVYPTCLRTLKEYNLTKVSTEKMLLSPLSTNLKESH